MFFFLLFFSEFHQEPELPVPPPSAMAGRPRGAGRGARERASAAAAALGSTRPAPVSRERAAGWEERPAACAGEENKTWLLGLSKSRAPQSHFLSSAPAGTGSAGVRWSAAAGFQRASPRPPERRRTNRLPGAAFWSGDGVLALPGFQDRAVVRPGSRATQGWVPGLLD